MKWGLIPRWTKPGETPKVAPINARAETLASKNAFKHAFAKRRCIIPADGFYEWKKEGKLKQPYLIHRKDAKPFAFAGLWSTWRNPEGGQPVETFTILTTDANDLLRPLHNRMPVIVDEHDYDGVNESILLDLEIGGVDRIAVGLVAWFLVLGWAAASAPWQLFGAAFISGAGWVTMGAVAVNAASSSRFSGCCAARLFTSSRSFDRSYSSHACPFRATSFQSPFRIARFPSCSQ